MNFTVRGSLPAGTSDLLPHRLAPQVDYHPQTHAKEQHHQQQRRALTEIPGGSGEESVIIDYEYDALYRLTAADYSSGPYFHYAYDPFGREAS